MRWRTGNEDREKQRQYFHRGGRKGRSVLAANKREKCQFDHRVHEGAQRKTDLPERPQGQEGMEVKSVYLFQVTRVSAADDTRR